MNCLSTFQCIKRLIRCSTDEFSSGTNFQFFFGMLWYGIIPSKIDFFEWFFLKTLAPEFRSFLGLLFQRVTQSSVCCFFLHVMNLIFLQFEKILKSAKTLLGHYLNQVLILILLTKNAQYSAAPTPSTNHWTCQAQFLHKRFQIQNLFPSK